MLRARAVYGCFLLLGGVTSGCHASTTASAVPASVFDPKNCAARLPREIRDAVATTWNCDLGTRCIDGHTGQSFRISSDDDDGYLDGERYYQVQKEGAPVRILVVATASCANDNLAGVAFETLKVSSTDSKTNVERRAVGPSKQVDAKPLRTAAQSVNEAAETAQNAISEARRYISALAGNEASMQVVSTRLEEASSKTPTKLRSALEIVDEVQSRLDTAAQRGVGDVHASALVRDARRTLTAAIEQSRAAGDTAAKLNADRSKSAREALDRATQLAQEADPNPAAIDASLQKAANNIEEWPFRELQVGGNIVKIAFREFEAVMPVGDSTASLDVRTSNEGAHVTWPSNTFYVHVDHGEYYWDFGLLFAAVYHGGASFADTQPAQGSVQPCSASNRWNCTISTAWGFQTMLTGSIFPAGRQKQVLFSTHNLVPGIQAGINSDVTKIQNAVSLGVVEELVDGLGISLGYMFFARPKAPTAIDGTQDLRRLFLPYVAVSLSSEFVSSIKAVTEGSKGGGSEKQ